MGPAGNQAPGAAHYDVTSSLDPDAVHEVAVRSVHEPLNENGLWPGSPNDPWDRRAKNRVRITLAVKQQVGKQVFLCQSGNLSPTGMFLARVYDRACETSPECDIEFGLPGHEHSIAAKARIVRQQRRGRYHLMGVRFASLDPPHRKMITDFLRRPPTPEEPQAFETAI